MNRSKTQANRSKTATGIIFAISTSIVSLTALLTINTTPASAATSTLNLTLSDSNVAMNIAPTSTNGSFSKSSTSTISASTNNATGYTLSIAASSSSTDASKLINTSDSTSALNSITSATTEEQFKALSATTYNNMWGYLPSKYCSDGTNATCSTNTSFLPAPSVSGDILDQTSTANTTANNYTIAIGARIDSTTKTGSYANSFIVKLVANAIPYTMVFDDSVVSDMPTDIDSTSMASTVSIPNQTPSREGYTFLGWCSVAVTTNNGIDSCSGTTYQPNGTVTINQTGTNNDFHFYAMWNKITQSSCPTSSMITTVAPGITYMQDINSTNSATVLSALTTGNTYQIKDVRDDETYCVGKLQDGKLWLLDNLALDLTNPIILNNISSINTNIDRTNELDILTSLKSGNRSAGDQYANGPIGNLTEGDSYTVARVNMDSKGVIPNDTTSKNGGYKVGGYYNFCAASIGSYCYGDGTSSGTSSGNATSDICPKGWRMPTGNTTGEYSALANAIYGSTGSTSDANAYANYRLALRLPLSGYFGGSTANAQGTYGYFRSSIRVNNTYMYGLYISGSISPANSSPRSSGGSVRCVAE